MVQGNEDKFANCVHYFSSEIFIVHVSLPYGRSKTTKIVFVIQKG